MTATLQKITRKNTFHKKNEKQKSIWIDPYFWNRFVEACQVREEMVKKVVKGLINGYSDSVLGPDKRVHK